LGQHYYATEEDPVASHVFEALKSFLSKLVFRSEISINGGRFHISAISQPISELFYEVTTPFLSLLTIGLDPGSPEPESCVSTGRLQIYSSCRIDVQRHG